MTRGKNSTRTVSRQEAKKLLRDATRDKRQAQKIAKAQIKEMRPFLKRLKGIDLRKSVSPQQRGYITKAWKEYEELTTRPFKVYRTKSKSKLEMAQAYARHDKAKPKFDVAFVPTADPHAKLTFKKDRVLIKSKHVTETVLFFDLSKLAKDAQREIERTIAREPNAKDFVIMAGKYLFNGGLSRSLVPEKVQMLMAKYNNEESNNYYANWLFGVVAAQYADQYDANEYRREFHRVRSMTKAAKQNARRRRVREFGKKF